MPARRWFFAPPAAFEAGTLVLSPEESRHLIRVLRLPVGAEVAVCDGQGRVAAAKVEDLAGGLARLRLLQDLEVPAESPLAVTLAVGLAKGDALDRVVEQATELGAARLVVFTSTFSEAGSPERLARRLARWRRLAREALKLCRRPRLPLIEAATFQEGLAGPEEGKILFYEEERLSLTALGGLPQPASVRLLIGPEGGFAAPEVAQARAASFVVTGLGPRRLRVETAAAAALSLVQYLWGDLG